MKSPFRSPDGKLFLQKDGIVMGSPLGPTFACFYMGHIEKNMLNKNPDLKPAIYCRYVDDIFVVTRDQPHLDDLKRNLENSSVLTFTSEISVLTKLLSYMSILMEALAISQPKYIENPLTKGNKCLNALSECPNKYKSSVVKGMIRRAHKIYSSWELFHLEILNIKKTAS